MYVTALLRSTISASTGRHSTNLSPQPRAMQPADTVRHGILGFRIYILLANTVGLPLQLGACWLESPALPRSSLGRRYFDEPPILPVSRCRGAWSMCSRAPQRW